LFRTGDEEVKEQVCQCMDRVTCKADVTERGRSGVERKHSEVGFSVLGNKAERAEVKKRTNSKCVCGGGGVIGKRERKAL
jgi:hypothetical protein